RRCPTGSSSSNSRHTCGSTVAGFVGSGSCVRDSSTTSSAVGPSARPHYARRMPESPKAIQMLHDRIMVKPGSAGERTSRGGILIPATAEVARRLGWGEVAGVGQHVRSVKVGDRVLFHPEDQYEVEVAGETYLVLRERDLHAVATDASIGGT